MKRIFLLISLLFISLTLFAQGRIRDFGIEPGIFRTGEHNAITDVPGVKVGQVTIIEGDDIRTGVTAIIPMRKSLSFEMSRCSLCRKWFW